MALVARALNIMINPSGEWERIAGEETSVGTLLTRYAMILAVIPAVTITCLTAYFGKDFTYANAASGRLEAVGIMPFILMGVIQYVVSMFCFFLLCLTGNAVSAIFNGWSGMVPGMKLMTYASTPAWVAGLINIIPFTGPLTAVVAHMYVIYLIHTGVQPILRIPARYVSGLTAFLIIFYAAMYILSMALAALLFALIVGSDITNALP